MLGIDLKNIYKTTFVIIGTIIGAGFASGQEIYLFFNRYGTWRINWSIYFNYFDGIYNL